MSMLRGFDASKVKPFDPDHAFEALPEGYYEVHITDTEEKVTKSGEGKFLALTFEVISGPHKGSTVVGRLNLENNSNVAVRIAKAQLSSICRAVNVITPNDAYELHGIPLYIKVSVKEDAVNDRVNNEIKAYFSKANLPSGAEIDFQVDGDAATSEERPW